MENIKISEWRQNKMNNFKERPYILLTPGPLTTSETVREAMLKDWCTWDESYNSLVQDMREKILDIATEKKDEYTVIPMQGSGTFSVESVLTTAVGEEDKILIISNGAYGDRMIKISQIAQSNYKFLKFPQVSLPNLKEIEDTLKKDSNITHVAVVHCETTSGILNPIKEIGEIVKKYGKIYIVDAMSSFGGIEFDMDVLGIDFLISSSNKCIQGVPGFGFVIGKKSQMEKLEGKARSHSLDIYDQWKTMENGGGKWRFTSPTHVVRGFYQALLELEKEGGVKSREKRYRENHKILTEGMKDLGFKSIIDEKIQSPIITTFSAPKNVNYNFKDFYENLKNRGFVIYPGKLTEEESFRIGNIGDVYPEDMKNLLEAVKKSIVW
ncbi:MAG: 2-aminoethylphosphonate--pyruvate transaminase [Fusobacteriaceae bacterium]